MLAAIGAWSLSGIAGCGGDGRESSTATPVETWAEGGPPDRDGWRVTFQDDFADGALDRAIWQNGYGDAHLQCPSHALHCAESDRSAVVDDQLVLTATQETPSVPPDEQWAGRPDPRYSVGAVTTDGAFQQEYGYFEAKMRVEAAPGTNPGFWLYVDTRRFDHRELNFEFYHHGDPGSVVRFSANYEDDAGERDYEQAVHRLDAPAGDRFRVLGLEWAPERVSYYVDGEHAHTIDHPAIAAHIAGRPLYLVCSWAVFAAADWVGDPAAAAFPLEQEYEWVRVWQRDEWA